MAASWECPSLPMLSLPFKETGKTSFLGLKPMISAHYEENPDTFSEEIKQLDQLRELSTKPKRDYNGCSVLRRYFAQLHLLRARFPPDTVGQIPVDFSWRDVFSGVEYIQEGFQIEQASVLYNISALHSQLGSHGKRETEQEMKEAVTHFQCSAGALSYLDEHFAINHASKDLTAEFVSFYNSLMLGQAQECLVEKSLKGIGRVKNLTISRLAARVAEYYSRCSGLLEGGNCAVIAKKNKDWPKLLKFKTLYYQSIAYYYQAVNAEEMGKYGELIALLQLTVQKLSSITGKPPKGVGDLMKQARQNFADHVTDKLTVAKRQNEQIYHDSVPSLENLELVSGADLVKPVSFHPTDSKNLGADIFSRLIPMRAHEVASIFSEEKAKLMRSIMSSVDLKDEELQQYMRSLNVTEVEKVHEEAPTIPDNVLRLHKAMQGRIEDVRKLHTNCQELIAMSKTAEEDFTTIRETKQKEEEEEEKFQSELGSSRPASKMVEGLWADLDQLHGYHVKAVKSNRELKTMFDQNYANLVLLTSPLGSLRAAIPKMTLLDTPSEETSESERWDKLLKEVEKMTQQRQTLVTRFREQMSHDDITRNLVGHLGNDQEVFLEDQMKQFKQLAAIIRQNLEAQDNILIALTEANAKKAGTRQSVQEIAQQQQTMFTGLVKSGGYLNLLKKKIQEGIGFYVKLHSSVSQLRKRSAEVCEARSRERQNIIQRQGDSVVPPDATSPPPPPPPPSTVPPHYGTLPPTPPPAPARPPKKAELAGNPLPPPSQHNLPPPGQGSSGGAIPSNHPTGGAKSQLLDIIDLQKVQMQQQAMLGGQISPSTSEMPQLGNTILPAIQSATVIEAQDTHITPAPPHAVSGPSTPVADAADALNNLNTLLQTNTNLPPVSQPGFDGSAGLVIDPSLLPQRPPKPVHLKAEPLPSPFPSLPPSLSEEQNSLPHDSSSTHPGGHHHHHHQNELEPTTSATSQPGPGQYQDPMSVSGPQDPSLQGIANLYPSHQPMGDIVPPQTSVSVPPTVSSSVLPPSAVIVDSSLPPPSNPGMGHNVVQPIAPHSLPTSPPYTYQPNINVQPGEVTVATSSVVTPIPSALPVPSNSYTVPPPSHPPAQPPPPHPPISLPPPPQPPTSSTPPPHPPTSSPPPLQQQEPATSVSPTPVTLIPASPNLLRLEDTIVPNSSSVTHGTAPDTHSIMTTSPSTVTISTDTVDLHSVNANTQIVNITGTHGPPTHSTNVNENGEIPDSTAVGSVSSTAAQVSGVISQTLDNVQTMALPETEPQTLSHMTTPVSSDPASTLSNVPVEPNDPSNVTTDAATLSYSNSNLTTTNTLPPSTSEIPSFSTTVSVTTVNDTSSSYALTNPISTSTSFVAQSPIQHLTESSSTTLSSTFPSKYSIASSNISTVQSVMPSHTLANSPLGLPSMPNMVPLPLTNLGSLSTSLKLDNPTDGTPLATELMLDTLSPQSLSAGIVQQLKKEVETLKTEREAQTKQEVAYRQQIAQLQQELRAVQMRQDQEKVAAFDQHSTLTKLLDQQQKMFSQQQNQMEKLSQQDESHRKEYLHVEEKFRETLRAEQEMKVSLQGQILHMTQENQKLNQTIQSQFQQVQTLQLHLQQYNIHIQERDKQLVTLRDQHNEIVGKLVKQSEQKVNQLMQKIQELQLQLNQRLQERSPMLHQPLQPTVVPQKVNPQQNQDLGPANIQQQNLPQPLQPNVVPRPPPPQPMSLQNVPRPTAASPSGQTIPPPPPQQGVGGPSVPLLPDQRMGHPIRHPPPQHYQMPASGGQQMQHMPPTPINSRPPSQPPGGPPTSQPPSSMASHQMQQMHGQQVRPSNLPSSQPPMPPSSGPHPPTGIQSPSTPHNLGPASGQRNNPPMRPVSHPPVLQSQGSYPSLVAQQPQRPQSHFHQPGSATVLPSQPSPMQQVPTSQPMMAAIPRVGPARQPILPPPSPQQQQQPQDSGSRFPLAPQMMQRGQHPMLPNQQPAPYGHIMQGPPQPSHHPQYRGQAP